MINQAFQNSHFVKKSRKRKLTYNKHRKPTLHSLIADHVLEMSVNSNSSVYVLKRSIFALVILNRFPICFFQGLFTQCDLYHRIILYYYAETKEMIYESLN